MHKVGDILKLTNLNLAHRSTKWGICVCVTETLVLFISSENRAMYECIPIKKEPHRKFPHYDSYIGCHQAYEVFPHHIASIDGRISKDEAQQIVRKIKASKRMSRKVKEKIILCLNSEFNLL